MLSVEQHADVLFVIMSPCNIYLVDNDMKVFVVSSSLATAH